MELKPLNLGGTMVTIGGSTGVFRSAGTLFYFDEIYQDRTNPDASKLRMNRVVNVNQAGFYKRNTLRG